MEIILVWSKLIKLANQIIELSEIGVAVQSGKDLGYRLKADHSPVTTADLNIEAGIKQILGAFEPGTPILAEESHGELNVDLKAAIQTGLFSVDPVDGTKPFSAGLPDWSTSVAHFKGGRPDWAIVSQPGYARCIVAQRGEGIRVWKKLSGPWSEFVRPAYPQRMIGLDLPKSLADSPQYWTMAHRLIAEYGFPRNEPSVFSGVELALGHTFAWFTASIAKHWDPAAGSLFVEEIGGVAECLDGSPIPWDRIDMPPLLFAESAEKMAEVRNVMGVSV